MTVHLLSRQNLILPILSLMLLVFITPVNAQAHSELKRRITVEHQQTTIKKLLKKITEQTGIYFMGSNDQVNLNEKIIFSAENELIERVLDNIFTSRGYKWTLKENVVTIIKSKNGPLNSQRNSDTSATIKGTITTEDGLFLPGATVLIKGSQIGTTSNNNGQFILRNIPDRSVVVISYTGYETQEFKISGDETIIARLKPTVGSLDETIIIGYGRTSKRLNTGNVSKVTSEAIEKQPVSNPLQALQGRVAGLDITQWSGTPGGYFRIRLRGESSLRDGLTPESPIDGNNPLFIIDGVPFPSTSLSSYLMAGFPDVGLGANRLSNPLNGINPSDIESIEVLKDADATAIYGSRGANGVILITTKRGMAGKTKIEASYESGWGKVTRTMKYMNTNEYIKARRQAFENDNVRPTVSNAPDLLVWDTTKYTDWQKLMIGNTAKNQNAQLTFSGGNEYTQFLIRGGYFNETTVYPGDYSYKKTSVHFNLNHSSLNRKFKVSLSSSYTGENNFLPIYDFVGASNLPPNAPDMYDTEGKINFSEWNGAFANLNPASQLLNNYRYKTSNLITNLTLNYEIVRNIFLKTSLGYSQLMMDEVQLFPIAGLSPFSAQKTGSSTFSDNSVKTWIVEPQLTYSKSLAGGKLEILVGATFQQDDKSVETLALTGYNNDELLESKAAGQIVASLANYSRYRYEAIFGRINYNFGNKYIANLTGRRDGSSRFGPQKQFANFGAIGGAWIFTNEDFLNSSNGILSFGKLRASYGITGNDQIQDYAFLDNLIPTYYSYQGNVGLFPNRLFNPDYSWETNKKIEVALELGFIKDRIILNSSYYRNRSSNQLIGLPLSSVTGFDIVQANMPALIQNSGLEFELNSTNIKLNRFKWTTSLNISIPRNKLISFPNLENTSFALNYAVGHPLTIFKALNYFGVDSETGIYTFQDINNDGFINNLDRNKIINVSNKFLGGLNNSFQYKGISLDIFFHFLNRTQRNYILGDLPSNIRNYPAAYVNRWEQPGDISEIQKLTRTAGPARTAFSNARNSEVNFEDASFLRLKNVSLSFQINQRWIERAKLQSARIYAQAQNLLTISSMEGLDPENTGLGQTVFLPPLRMITIGIQLSF